MALLPDIRGDAGPSPAEALMNARDDDRTMLTLVTSSRGYRQLTALLMVASAVAMAVPTVTIGLAASGQLTAGMAGWAGVVVVTVTTAAIAGRAAAVRHRTYRTGRQLTGAAQYAGWSDDDRRALVDVTCGVGPRLR